MSLYKDTALQVAKGELVLKKIGLSDRYPGKNNCYRVQLTDTLINVTWDSHFYSIAEYDLYMKAKEIYAALNIKNLPTLQKKAAIATFENIFDLIEKYGDERYEEASDNAAMDAAGEAL